MIGDALISYQQDRFNELVGREFWIFDSFWENVDVGSLEECWTWNGVRSKKPKFPYGYTRRDFAHRIAYRIAKGTIPSGMHVRHACDNPTCVNPSHLLLGTPKDNVRDRTERNPYFRRAHARKAFGLRSQTFREALRVSRRYKRKGPRRSIPWKKLVESAFFGRS
jgi:hypothetical protein